jgi:hypothetical protein
LENVYFKHNQNITKITAMQINSLLFFIIIRYS